MSNIPIRLVIADDQRFMRAALRNTLLHLDHLEVVGEAPDRDEAIELCRELAPDILLLDLMMGGTPAREAVAALRSSLPRLRVLIVSVEDAPPALHELVEAGIAGYVLKDDSADALFAAIQTVAAGGTWFSRALLHQYPSLLEKQPVG